MRGRGFLRQQVRRIVAVAVLAARGALPADAFEVLTRRDVVLSTPLPPDLAYFAGARYDFVEKRGAGDLFAGGGATDAWQRDLRSTVAARSSAAWLRDFEAGEGPALRAEGLGVRPPGAAALLHLEKHGERVENTVKTLFDPIQSV